MLKEKKQQIRLKGKPHGRPWPKGVSGNPRGRPRGARNKWSLAVGPPRPLVLDRKEPYESWGRWFIQRGRKFRKDNLEEIPCAVSYPKQPKLLDIRKPRTMVKWKRKYFYIQNGWLFDRRTWKAVKN